jgi:hypothetical protein
MVLWLGQIECLAVAWKLWSCRCCSRSSPVCMSLLEQWAQDCFCHVLEVTRHTVCGTPCVAHMYVRAVCTVLLVANKGPRGLAVPMDPRNPLHC